MIKATAVGICKLSQLLNMTDMLANSAGHDVMLDLVAPYPSLKLTADALFILLCKRPEVFMIP